MSIFVTVRDASGYGECFRHGLQAALLQLHPNSVFIMDSVNFIKGHCGEEMVILDFLPSCSPIPNPLRRNH